MSNNSRIAAIVYFALILFSTNETNSCPRCNLTYYDQLLKSGNTTLAGQELLNAIKNQGIDPKQYAETYTITEPPSAGSFFQQQQNVDFLEIINRDNGLQLPPTSYVPQNIKPDTSVKIELYEAEYYIGKGVMYKGFVTNGTIPGPTIIVDEGDIVEFSIHNKGTIPHGASIHSAYTQTSKYVGNIAPGETKKVLFKATQPGVFLYHCAPGGHAIPMHVLFGQYGMMVVRPKQPYKLEQALNKKPDVELYILQHELYSSGKDAIEGNPIYTMFNGKLFRYVEEPVKAKPGDYVRIYYLNVGPNKVSTFHIVGILWDYVYWQGNPSNQLNGGQTVLSGPSDSWVIEFRMPPDEGSFLMLDHAVGAADRGAIGILKCTKEAVTPVVITADGISYTEQQMSEFKSKIVRNVAPFEPGTPDVDPVAVYGPETKEVLVKIIGNSFYPKTIQVAPGTTVKWINEDIFTYMEGEFAALHNAASYEGPESFNSPLLGHAETFSFEFKEEGDYKYLCSPHPYMRGAVIVTSESGAGKQGSSPWLIVLSILSLSMIILLFVKVNAIRKQIKE